MGKRLFAVMLVCIFLSAQVDVIWAESSSSGGSKSSSSSSSGSRSSSYSNSSSSRSSSGSPSRSYGNSSSKRGSSSASHSSSKYGNTSTTSSGGSTSSGKYGNTGGSSGGSSGSAAKGAGPFGQAGTKEISSQAFSKYEAERSRFKTPDAGQGATSTYSNSSVFSRTTYNADTYAQRRGTFYGGHNYTPPPYIYRSYPSFGMWDATFLWFMLDNISRPHYSQMYYNHQNDPGFQQWRKEADKLSAENKELKEKLDTMDKEVAKLKGQPVDETYMPPGVDHDILMDKQALDSFKKVSAPAPKKAGFGFWKLLFALLVLAAVAYIIVRILRSRRGGPPTQKYKLD